MFLSRKRTKLNRPKTKKPAVYCLPVFLIVPGRSKTLAEAVERGFSLIQQHLLACQADSYYGVMLPRFDLLKPYLDLYPEERAWISRLLQQERCAIGECLASPYTPAIGAEALIRNVLLGRTLLSAFSGSDSPVYCHFATPAGCMQMPQILSHCGFEAAVVLHDEQDPTSLPKLYKAWAPDGSSLYVYPIPNALEQKAFTQLIEEWQAQLKEKFSLDTPLIVDLQEDRPPRAQWIGLGQSFSERVPPLFITGTGALPFFSRIHTAAQSRKLRLEPVSHDPSRSEEGGAISRIDLKRANRLLENRLYEAEFWQALAHWHGAPHAGQELGRAWRQAVYAHPPEGVAGFGCDLHFLDVMESYRSALERAVGLQTQALKRLSEKINTQNETDQTNFVVFNPLPWRYSALASVWVEVEDETSRLVLMDRTGEAVPYEVQNAHYTADDRISRVQLLWAQPELPAAGYLVLNQTRQPEIEMPFLQRGQSQTWLENDFFRLEVDPERGGGITSLFDKVLEKEFIAANAPRPANDVWLVMEQGAETPAKHFQSTGQTAYASDLPSEAQYMQGEVSDRLYIRGQGPGHCKRVQEICLYHELPYIDITTVLEKRPSADAPRAAANGPLLEHYMLAYPFDLPGALPVYEDRFYAKAGWVGANRMDFRSATPHHPGSAHGLQAAYRWMDLSWAFLIRFMHNDELTGTLAPGPSDIVTAPGAYNDECERLIEHLTRHGVSCTPRADHEVFQLPMAPPFVVAIGSREENQLVNRLLEGHPEAFAYYERGLEQVGFVVFAAPAILAGQETPTMVFAGKTPHYTQQAVAELLESTVRHRWECPAAACFLNELDMAENCGLAVLNRGAVMGGVEPDGTLLLSLMRTSPFVTQQTEWPFDFAEHKTHVFQHRLLPHGGDWRDAEIPRRAMEYNHPPVVIEEPAHEGDLASRHSFFSLEPGNLLISALKLEGSAHAEFHPEAKLNPTGVLRLYEAHGEATNLWIESGLNLRSARAVQIDESALPYKHEVVQEEPYVRCMAHAFEIVTLRLDIHPEHTRRDGSKPSEPAEPETIPARYWRRNLGDSAGGMPFSVLLRGRLAAPGEAPDTTIQHLDLVLVNNAPQTACEGTAELTCSPGWRVVPAQVRFRLQGGGYQIAPIQVVFDQPAPEGYVKASAAVGDRRLEEMIHAGPPPDLGLEMALTQEAFYIYLQHPYAYEVSGTVSLIVPPEAWPHALAGELSLSHLESCRSQFCIPPEEQIALCFPLAEAHNRFGVPSDRYWMVVKIALHNSVRYYHVRLDGEPSEGLGRILYPPYDG